MTSVPNRQQQLNGSRNWISLLFLAVFILSSCGSTKNVSDRGRTPSRPKRPVVKAPKKPTKSRIDTVQWDVVDETTSPPIGKAAGTPVLNKDAYNITLLIPFDANKYRMKDVLDSRSGRRFSNYYGGVLMALDAFEKEGKRLNVNILDSQDKNIKAKLNLSSTKSADIIIGPYNRDQLKEVTKFGKENDIVVVSPWQAIRDAEDADANYVQLRPALNDYYLKMLTSAYDRYGKQDIRILTRENNKTDAKRAAALRRLAIDNEIIGSTDPFEIVQLNEDSLIMGESAYDSMFYDMNKSIFIVPNWSSRDENFIYSSLRRMSVEKGPNEVHVYGMPIILDSDKIDFEFYKNLDINVVRWKFVDENKFEVKDFRRKFLNKFGSLPTEDAYDAYDMMNYVIHNVSRHGKYFQYKPNAFKNYLQTDFDIQPDMNEVSEFGSDNKINYFVNKHLYVVRFDGRYFSKR